MSILEKYDWFPTVSHQPTYCTSTKLLPEWRVACVYPPHSCLPENVSHFASLPRRGGARGQSRTQKKPRSPLGDIWGMPNMTDEWRRSCARPRARMSPRNVELWGPLTHDSVCLVSDTERQNQLKSSGRGRERNGGKGGRREGSVWKADGADQSWRIKDRCREDGALQASQRVIRRGSQTLHTDRKALRAMRLFRWTFASP